MDISLSIHVIVNKNVSLNYISSLVLFSVVREHRTQEYVKCCVYQKNMVF